MPTPAVRHRPLMATLFARVGKAGAELTAPLTSMNVKKVSNLSYSFFILEWQDAQWMSRKWVTCPTLYILECQEGVQACLTFGYPRMSRCAMNVKKVSDLSYFLFILECQEGVQRMSTKRVTYPALCLSLNVKRVCKPALLFVIDPWMWVTCLTLETCQKCKERVSLLLKCLKVECQICEPVILLFIFKMSSDSTRFVTNSSDYIGRFFYNCPHCIRHRKSNQNPWDRNGTPIYTRGGRAWRSCACFDAVLLPQTLIFHIDSPWQHVNVDIWFKQNCIHSS